MSENSTSNVTELNKVQEVLLRPSCLQPSSETCGAEIPGGWDVLAAQCVGPGVRMPLEQEGHECPRQSQRCLTREKSRRISGWENSERAVSERTSSAKHLAFFLLDLGRFQVISEGHFGHLGAVCMPAACTVPGHTYKFFTSLSAGLCKQPAPTRRYTQMQVPILARQNLFLCLSETLSS